MKRGFFFTVTIVLLFSLLVALAGLRTADESRVAEVNAALVAAKAASAWENVAAQIPKAAGMNVSRWERNVSVADSLPAQGTAASLAAVQAFAAGKYSPGGLGISFAPSLETIAPAMEFRPTGWNYSYSSWSKNDLGVMAPVGNFSFVRNLSVAINVSSHWFKNAPNSSCGADVWAAYAGCTGATVYCLWLDLWVWDANGTYYHSSCAPVDAGQANLLVVQFANATSPLEGLGLQFGPVPRVFNTSVAGTGIRAAAGTVFAFNTTAYRLAFQTRLRVADSSGNYSIEDWANT